MLILVNERAQDASLCSNRIPEMVI